MPVALWGLALGPAAQRPCLYVAPQLEPCFEPTYSPLAGSGCEGALEDDTAAVSAGVKPGAGRGANKI